MSVFKGSIFVRVLNILMDWLENYGMADNDPHIVPQLQQFLSRINKDSASLSLTAKGHLQSLDRVSVVLFLPNSCPQCASRADTHNSA